MERRVAVVHEWLTTYAGSERVLEQILRCYPNADLFCVADFVPPKERHFLGDRRPHTSFVQNLPLAATKVRHYLPLMPLAVEQFDLSGYDIVISSSHAVAKGVLTGPEQLHVSYVHSPMRYAWDFQHQYLDESGLDRGAKSWAARYMLHRLRAWDFRSAQNVDELVANSAFISRRIWKTYRREAAVIHPPVDTQKFSARAEKDDFYLSASRMVPYKRMDLIAEAFAASPERRLVIVGDGPEMAKVARAARGAKNIEVLGYQPDSVLLDLMQRARAFVFAAEEDFGITPVEAQACGTPVIALAKGGAVETIRGLDVAKPTGVFFNEQSARAIQSAVSEFEARATDIRAEDCRENAIRFGADRFRAELTAFVTRAFDERRRRS